MSHTAHEPGTTHHDPRTGHATGHATAGTSPRRSWALLAVALAAQVLVVLDISVVNTALPTIGADLDLDGGQLQWLVTAYLMMSGGGLLFGGRVADLLSRRGVFLTGLGLFTAASVVSGLSDTGTQLFVARALQGLSAALLTPAALSLITTGYDGAQRKAALAMWGAVGSLGVAAGVLVGGAITTWSSWQFIFWVNAPIGVVALLAGTRVITKEARAAVQVRDFDVPGAMSVIASLATLVYALGTTSTYGWWSVHTVATLAVSAAVLFLGFLRVETKAPRPLFPPHVWKLQSLVSGTAVMLGVTGILVGAVFLCSIYLQTVLGFSALQTGLAFLPFAFAITVGTLVARHLLGHLSPRVVATAGLVLAAAASGGLSTLGSESQYAAAVLPWLVGLGLGVGMVFVPVSVTSMSGIPASHAGVAGGFLMTGHEVGAALGVAVLSAVAGTAGSLATSAGAAEACTRGFAAAAAIAAGTAVFAMLRMPAAKVEGGAGMHMHH